MPLSTEHLETLDRLDREILELQYQGQRLRLWLTLRAGYKPGQPRWPRGHDGAGRWSGGPGIGHNSEPSGIDQNFEEQSPQEVENFHDRIAFRILQELLGAAGAAALLGVPMVIATTSSTASDDTVDAAIRASGKKPSDFIPPGVGPGPYTKGWIPAAPADEPGTATQSTINKMGSAWGCSTCGTMNSGLESGNWVGDHQPPTAFNSNKGRQSLLPQCIACSDAQGGRVNALLRRFSPKNMKSLHGVADRKRSVLCGSRSPAWSGSSRMADRFC
jgi:hypothetical protein